MQTGQVGGTRGSDRVADIFPVNNMKGWGPSPTAQAPPGKNRMLTNGWESLPPAPLPVQLRLWVKKLPPVEEWTDKSIIFEIGATTRARVKKSFLKTMLSMECKEQGRTRAIQAFATKPTAHQSSSRAERKTHQRLLPTQTMPPSQTVPPSQM